MEDAEIVEKMHPNTVKRVKSLINNTSWVLDIKKTLFTSDPLEKQCCKLRKGCRGTYFLKKQQILEKVKIAKTNRLLNLDVNINGFSIHSCDKCGYLLDNVNVVF